MGDMHQGEHPFTNDLAARSQCSPMSYTSVLYASLTNICSWSANDVNDVMLQGHILYTNQLNFLHRIFPYLDHRFAIDELPKEPIILMGNTPVSFQVNMLTTTFSYFRFFSVSLLKFCIRKIT